MEKDSFLKDRVKVMLINPSYGYFGIIIGKDSEMVYLDTGDYQGVMGIPLSNISTISKADKKVMT